MRHAPGFDIAGGAADEASQNGQAWFIECGQKRGGRTAPQA